MNLWDETIEVLEANNKDWDDVVDICGNDFCITKDNYKEIAIATNYYNGFGSPEIAQDLELTGADFKLVRYEYDGSESFEFISFKRAERTNIIYIERLKITDKQIGWESLASVNGLKER